MRGQSRLRTRTESAERDADGTREVADGVDGVHAFPEAAGAPRGHAHLGDEFIVVQGGGDQAATSVEVSEVGDFFAGEARVFDYALNAAVERFGDPEQARTLGVAFGKLAEYPSDFAFEF